MSARLLLRAVVNERLTAAAEEIFQLFERAITKYEEEASSSKQEIDRLRGLLETNNNTQTDFSQSSICKEETPPEQQQQSLSIYKPEPEPRHIKEEHHELWTAQLQEEEEQDEEFSDAAGDSYLPQSSVWEENDPRDTKPPLIPQTENSDNEEQLQELQGAKTAEFILPLASTSQTLIQSETVQDGRESERPAMSLINQTQTDMSQSSFIAYTELCRLNSATNDYRCYLCDKSFSSNRHLINHASRIHSKGADVLCAVCGKSFESTESLNVHLESHQRSKCCHVCGKHLSSTTALTEHMASHAGVKLHRCHVCGKECGRKGDLKIHMRIHTGEKPYRCSFCRKSFTHSGHLRKHMRTHTGERPHQCDVCGRGFLQSTHLKYHLGTHAQKY